MDTTAAEVYLPLDRRQALAQGEELPDRTQGTALTADISGFTRLTDALVQRLGHRRGASVLTRQLNAVYGALITEVHRYGGSVIGFSGDAITCWFDGDSGERGTACALAMQQAMQQFETVSIAPHVTVSLAMKAAVAAGPVRRFQVGDPNIQYIDVLAGATVDRLALGEELAQDGEVVVDAQVTAHLADQLAVAQWRQQPEKDQLSGDETHHSPASTTPEPFAVISHLKDAPPPESLPGSATQTPQQHLTMEQIRPWLLRPVYEQWRAIQGRFLAEIRPAVALFLRFTGLTYDDDDAAGDKLDAYIRWVQNVLAGYEGFLIQLTMGDKGSYLYAAFGAPLAHDDDPVRAVAAALALRSPPPDLAFITAMQIGISQGQMRVGAYGSPLRRTYGVLGDEVNVAARLMEQAEPGQIMISKRIAKAITRHYRLKFIGEIAVKGKQERLPVSLVLGTRLPTPQQPATIFTNPLVGREAEITHFDQILTAVIAGSGQILRIEGLAGIGKSHLAAEFVERALAHNVQAAVGTSQSTTQGVAYYPWRQLLRALLHLTDEPPDEENRATWIERQVEHVQATIEALNPDWLIRLPLLGDLLALPIPDNETTAAFEPKLRQEALFALVVELIQTWAQAQPLLLLLEDVHWLDETSRELTLALGRVMAALPVLLVVVHRPQEQPLLADLTRLAYHHRLELTELTPPDMTGLVTNHLQGRVSPLVLDLIQARAQGNPFYSEELVDALRETNQLQLSDELWRLSESVTTALRQANCLVYRNQQWRLASDAPLETVDLNIPDTIQGIVLSRLDRLPELYKLTMKVASVIGHTFELDLLAQAHPLQPTQARLQEQLQGLEERDLVRIETSQPHIIYIFKHNITQEVVYDTLLESHQRTLHRAVGKALEALQPQAVERLAYHYRLGNVRDKTLFYLDRAARKTQRDYANETALNYYNQALALEERWTWRKGQIEILHLLGRREEEMAGLEVLAANSEAPKFEVAYLWGQYYEVVGNYAAAQAAVEQAIVLSRNASDLAGEVHCLAQLGLIAYRQGDHETAKFWYHQALDLFQQEKIDSNEVMQAFIQTFDGLGTVHHQQGELDQARSYYEQALTLSRTSNDRHGEANTLFGLGVVAFYQRHFADAENYYRQALTILRALGDRAGEGTTLYSLAQVIGDAGDYSQALQYLSAALTILHATGNRWHEIDIWNSMGIYYRLLGVVSKAQDCLERGLCLAREIGAEEEKSPYLLSNLGLTMRDQGKLAEAQQLLITGLDLVQTLNNKHQISFFLSYLGTVSLQAGQLETAIEQAQAALTLRRELGLRLRTTYDLSTLAAGYLAAGDIANALSHIEEVWNILAECKGEGPQRPQRDYFISYQVLTAVGQQQRALVALKLAYNLITVRAHKITNPTLRQAFLDQVKINREIVIEAKKQLSDTT